MRFQNYPNSYGPGFTTVARKGHYIFFFFA